MGEEDLKFSKWQAPPQEVVLEFGIEKLREKIAGSGGPHSRAA
jgi:hypothetical protein